MSETTSTMSKHVSPPDDISPPLPRLPWELISQILLRVPVSSLLRFRCVSKSWKTLISHPRFVKDHLHVSITNSNMAHLRLAFSIYQDSYGIASFPVQLLSQNPSIPLQVCHFDMGVQYHIIGSCNGLLCLTDPYDNFITLWNPTINLLSESLPLGFFPNTTFIGFGYDDMHDKYKLLGVTKNANYDEIITRIYTFGVDSWTVIPNLQRHPAHCLGKFLNGNLNWVAKKYPSDDRLFIINLNLATETYGEMVLCEGDKDKIFFPGLSILRNCLCLHFYESEKTHSVVWMMKKYGVEDSWTKLITIPHNDPLLYPVFFELLCISENGKVVVLLNIVTFEIVLYNSSDGRFSSLGIRGNYGRYPQIYHESLVPLPF